MARGVPDRELEQKQRREWAIKAFGPKRGKEYADFEDYREELVQRIMRHRRFVEIVTSARSRYNSVDEAQAELCQLCGGDPGDAAELLDLYWENLYGEKAMRLFWMKENYYQQHWRDYDLD